MFDDRLSKEENNALIGEDIYDIHEIFEDTESCIEFIHKKTNISKSDIQKEFETESNEYCFMNDLSDYYCVDIANVSYVGFKTGRIVVVEFY